jgi:YbgC/YbaW family acyl-CoA thioester hydrolase
MPAVFRTSRRIEFADTDMAGIVHFANFFRFMEAAEQAFLRSRGLSVAFNWEGQPIGFPRVSASCDYLRPVRFEDVLEIRVQVAKVGCKSVSYDFEFYLAENVVARGQVTAVCCRAAIRGEHPPDSPQANSAPHALESIEIPATLRSRLLEELHGDSGGSVL